jgi:hypothetical protein
MIGVPEPVARYLRFALASSRAISGATLHQRGALRDSADARWMPFSAVERFSIEPVGFRWIAWIRPSPLLALRVCDAYQHGRGASNASLFGLVSVGSQRGSRAINEASLVRFLAESPWIPPLLASSRIQWQTCDARTARASLSDSGHTVAVDFTFGDAGEITRVSTQRYRAVGKESVLTPWRGYFTDYEPMDGMMIPGSARVEWAPPSGRFEVWRGQIVDARFYLSDSTYAATSRTS